MAITRSGSSSPTPNSKMEASSSILRIRGISMKSKADKGKRVRSKISGKSEKKRSAPDGSNDNTAGWRRRHHSIPSPQQSLTQSYISFVARVL
ncbi:hypothetical protein TorRG33x02_025110 [Trema orientale]|uniref:Uncharacterized protein n=1 Tax=Trema orientale TaxID=63057 RepID=A0A2P5FVA3_TREOI|nr:hypothetical protein TorRG33x02_025110 [Trema orientale]